MVAITPYLSVSNAQEASKLYNKIFGAELIESLPVVKEQAAGMGIPEDIDLSKTTMHSTLKIGDAMFFMSDNFGKEVKGTNTSLLLTPDSIEQAKEWFNKAETNGCSVEMKFEKQFWGDHFGRFTDPYGISWQANFTPGQD